MLRILEIWNWEQSESGGVWVDKFTSWMENFDWNGKLHSFFYALQVWKIINWIPTVFSNDYLFPEIRNIYFLLKNNQHRTVIFRNITDVMWLYWIFYLVFNETLIHHTKYKEMR